jgi:UDP:flavonoid glycosyltransferase YjiC (YdhE family)
MLAVPIENQYEQELNARYLKELGYGSWTRRLGLNVLREFLERTGEFEKALSRYEGRDNRIVLACLEELISRVGGGKKRPKRLETKALGSFGD